MGQTIAVIDYSMGNLRSVSKAIEHVAGDVKVIVTDDARQIADADRIVFPGQGAARDCMRAIEQHGLRQVIMQAATEKPFLGICMGLQVLLSHSEENDGTELLGLFDGEVSRFDNHMSGADGHRLKIPHMGWSQVEQAEHPLWQGIEDKERFYFVHSYYVSPADTHLAIAHTDYGIRYTSAIAKDKLFAVQFHPEKSADAGLQLLRNFVNWSV